MDEMNEKERYKYYDKLINDFKLSKYEKFLGYHIVIIPDKEVSDNYFYSDRCLSTLGFRFIKKSSIRLQHTVTKETFNITIFLTKESIENVREFYKNLKNTFILKDTYKCFEAALDFIYKVKVCSYIKELEDDTKYVINKDIIKMLREVETNSTCAAKHVGCLILRRKRDKIDINSAGYNFSKGHNQCKDLFIKKNNEWYYREFNHQEFKKDETGNRHKEWSLKHEIHAEITALIYAEESKCKLTKNDFMVITYTPCENCMNEILKTPIKNIISLNKFDDYEEVRLIADYNNVNLYYIDQEKELNDILEGIEA